MEITHKNHYVPIWYQKRFLRDGMNTLFHLDLYPERKKLSDGRVIKMNDIHIWSPSKCFWFPDLYTTTFFGIQNDEIERLLFGPIDYTGSKALVALVNNDISQLHELFMKFFEYIDAQKLRTPKGLTWIHSHYPALAHAELLLEMQRLQQMNVTMWVESVREIVSAENSAVKFIVSDHPVTIYNYASDPNSELCKYPEDPSIALKGSQTIFPLDLNHCIILTNLEYAKDPKGANPLTNRTHARFHGSTLARIDTMIRTRQLTDAEVTAINFVLKSRAGTCIAAAEREWLFPEKTFTGSWHAIREVLLPPKDETWQFGGEIFAGGKKGDPVYYQDAFGRTMHHSEYLRKEIKKKNGANDPCPCGSGKKYKKCCKDKPPSQRPSFEECSIRERNIMLIRAVIDILGLNKGKTWEDIRRELNDQHVKEIYQVVGSLWSPETDLMSLLPHPDPNVFRALYAGFVDPRVILRNVVGFSLYVDEILVQSPFLNPRCLKEEISPITCPQQYKQQTLKDVLLLLQLAPFIEAGIVNLFPDPCDFDYQLRKDVWSTAEKRLKNYQLEEQGEDIRNFEVLFKDDFIRSMFSLPDEAIRHQLKNAIPDIKDETLEKTLEYIKEIRNADPLSLLQTNKPGKENAYYLISHFGPNLELNLFIAQTTGSFVYTDSTMRWKEILTADDTGGKSDKFITHTDFERALSTAFTFLNQVNPETALRLRQSAKLGQYRKQLRELWKRVLLQSNEEVNPDAKQQLCDSLTNAHLSAMNDWTSVIAKLQKEMNDPMELLYPTIEAKLDWVMPIKGFGMNNVYRLLLTHSRRTDYLVSLPMAVFVHFKDEGKEYLKHSN
jgi:uncharacterized protein YchJ